MLRTQSIFIPLLLLLAAAAHAQLPANFSWINIESDQKVMPLVRRALHDNTITSIREVGVEDGYALVMTASRSSGDPTPDYDVWTIYSIALDSGKNRILASGYGVRVSDWLGSKDPELAVTYFSCWQCEPETFITTIHFVKGKGWQTRWPNKTTDPARSPLPGAIVNIGDMGAPYDDNEVDQIYAIVKQPNEGFAVGTWVHSRNTVTGKIDDNVERYSVDPTTGADRVETLKGQAAQAWKRQICTQSNILIQPASGQDSKLCRALLKTPATPPKAPK